MFGTDYLKGLRNKEKKKRDKILGVSPNFTASERQFFGKKFEKKHEQWKDF